MDAFKPPRTVNQHSLLIRHESARVVFCHLNLDCHCGVWTFRTMRQHEGMQQKVCDRCCFGGMILLLCFVLQLLVIATPTNSIYAF